MTSISEKEARTQYMWCGKDIIGYSLKVASTFLYAHITGKAPSQINRGRARRIGQHEALQERKEGTDVWLFVRHPLDRLVSNYVFWTKVANSYIKDIHDEDLDAHNRIMGNGEYKNISIEDWWEAANKHYNPHWFPQVDYHTRDGILVPNIILPVESLTLLRAEKMNKSPRTAWEDYFTDDFRQQMEEFYAADLALYEKAKEEWDGQAPAVLRSNR